MKKPIGKILWRGLGPLLIAIILVAALMLVPFKFGRSSQATIRQAASSMSANVLKGETIKNEAMAENYVPFIGSSELSRMDAFHPSIVIIAHFSWEWRERNHSRTSCPSMP